MSDKDALAALGFCVFQFDSLIVFQFGTWLSHQHALLSWVTNAHRNIRFMCHLTSNHFYFQFDSPKGTLNSWGHQRLCQYKMSPETQKSELNRESLFAQTKLT